MQMSKGTEMEFGCSLGGRIEAKSAVARPKSSSLFVRCQVESDLFLCRRSLFKGNLNAVVLGVTGSQHIYLP